MKINQLIVFYDNKEHINHIIDQLCIYNINTKLINFYTTNFDELKLISKYRIVMLPSIVGLNVKSKVILKLVGEITNAIDYIKLIED
jgi:hypothetical protein